MGQLQQQVNVKMIEEMNLNSYSIKGGRLVIRSRELRQRKITAEEIRVAKEEFFLRKVESCFN